MSYLPDSYKVRSGPGVSGKVDAIAYPQSALGGTPETLRPKRGIKMGQKLRARYENFHQPMIELE
jgi:hypothetical protein